MTSKSTTTWRELIREEMRARGETFMNVVAMAPSSDEWMSVEFDDGFGATHGIPFTVWTDKRVYFPVCYDGAEWCESVSRNPDGKETMHIGGG